MIVLNIKPLNIVAKSAVKVLVAGLLLLSCKQAKIENRNSDKGIKIIKPNLESFSTLKIKNSSIIELETSENSLIGTISKMVTDKFGNILITDNRDENRVLIFNASGNYSFTFSAIGNGPEEYSKLSDFSVSEDSLITILDDQRRSLYKFNYFTQKFTNEIRLPFYASKFETLSDSDFIFYTDQKVINSAPDEHFYELILTDKDLKIKDTAMPFFLVTGRTNFNISSGQVFSSNGKEVIFNKFLSDSIVVVGSGSIETKYIIDYGDEKLNLSGMEFSSAVQKLNYVYSKRDEKVLFTTGLFLYNDELVFSFPYKNYPYFGKYSISNGSTQTFSELILDDKKIDFLPPPKFMVDNKFVSVIDYTYASYMIENKFDNLSPNMIEKLEMIIKGEKNPMLIFYAI